MLWQAEDSNKENHDLNTEGTVVSATTDYTVTNESIVQTATSIAKKKTSRVNSLLLNEALHTVKKVSSM